MTAREARRAKEKKEILDSPDGRCFILETPGRGGINCKVRLLDAQWSAWEIAWVCTRDLEPWH